MEALYGDIVGLVCIGTDGRKVGKVIDQEPQGFTVERGMIFPRDQFIPLEELVRVVGGLVVLREPAAYYRAGGDMDDGHWNAEKARRSRLVRQREVAHEVGLHDPMHAAAPPHLPGATLSPEEEDEDAGGPGVHLPRQ